jgi:UDP-N-acetylmuramoylalanine--D-glutamate ligase
VNDRLEGRRAVVMGLGRFGGGLGAARHLAARGARVTVTDARSPEELAPSLEALADLDVRLVLGRHDEADFDTAELVVANPAVPPSSPFLERARRAGAQVTSEIELALAALAERGARIACITGTQGKTSTCTLLGQLLEACGLRAHVGGNLGGSLLETVAAVEPGDRVVVELSSYQLEALAPEPARAAEAVLVTNVLADHIERHGSRAAYGAAKLRVLELLAPGGLCVAGPGLGEAALPDGALRLPELPDPRGVGASLEGGRFLLGEEDLGDAAALPLAGAFQRVNALGALAVARALGAPADALARALGTLRGPAHRLEDLGLHAGARVWDNGASTTPDSTVSALRALEGPLVLLAGGRRKADLDYPDLAREAAARTRLVVLFGRAAPELAALLEEAGCLVRTAPDLARATALADELLEQGDTLLFSPACDSFDAYPNWQVRAEEFRASLASLGARARTAHAT